jgi:hypothetical protein
MAEPVALGVKPPQAMTLGDMINIARGAQAYQQAEQANPLELKRLQAEANVAAGTVKPRISKAASEAETAGITTAQKQLELDQSHFNLAGNILSGLKTRAQSLAKKGDIPTAVNEFNAAKSWINASGIPYEKNGAIKQAEEQLKNKDFNGYLATLENMENVLGGAASRYQANLPSLTRNAAGEIISANPLTNKMEIVRGPGNINLTSTDVELGKTYQQNLADRVVASNQFLQRAEEIEPLLNEFKPGAGTSTYAKIAEKLQALGAPQGLVDSVAKGDLSAVQSLNKFMAQSVMSTARQAASGKPYANEIDDFVKNNPTIETDPRALKRFIDFNKKLARTDLVENETLAQAKERGIYNPGTWQADWQKIAQSKGLLPKTPSAQPKETAKEPAKSQERTVVRQGTYNGRTVIEYSDGSVRYK